MLNRKIEATLDNINESLYSIIGFIKNLETTYPKVIDIKEPKIMPIMSKEFEIITPKNMKATVSSIDETVKIIFNSEGSSLPDASL